ncbi:MAG: phage portal protein [Planctomycetes bacterium]|nr:phage portal protein [Planctomycetota bacterium]
MLGKLFGPSRAAMASTIADQRAAIGKLVRARFDAAETTPLNKAHWAASDHLSADAALSPMKRRTMRSRARYEAANNGYLAGMVATLATDAIGTGPTLLLDCGPDADQSAVARVEENVFEWHQSIDLARKLRIMRQAKAIDGEVFGIEVNNRKLRNVQLDLRLVEAEMIADPASRWDLAGSVDGVRFDDDGNPSEYYLLRHHPGSMHFGVTLDGDWVQAGRVLHYFHATRPGQHRGMGEVVPALELFAMLRRYQYAVVTAAETAADLAVILKTTMPADGGAVGLPAWETMPLARGMAMAGPEGWEPYQLKAEQPTSTFDAFERRILMQISRSLNMPYIVAVMDATGANYSTMRGDYLVYRKHMGAERSEVERVVLDPLLERWIEEATFVDGMIPDGLPPRDQWTWRWRWDGFEHIDPLKEADAETVGITNKTTSRAESCARRGKDWRQVFRQIAAEEAYAAELGIDLAPAARQPVPADAPADQTQEQPA